MEKISFEEYNEWATVQAGIIEEYGEFDAEEAFEEEGVQFHKGNLSVDTLNISPCVVVDGDLEIKGEIDWEFERGLLIINGNLKCIKFTFPFQTVVTGSIYTDGVYLNSGCDYYLIVGGDIHAKKYVVEDGHVITVLGKIYSPKIKSLMNEISVEGEIIERSEDDDGEFYANDV